MVHGLNTNPNAPGELRCISKDELKKIATEGAAEFARLMNLSITQAKV